jgi:hypothetical protein
MVNTDPPKHAGGEYGDVRARIDQDKLNAYLTKNVPAVTVPVTVKQFKVRRLTIAPALMGLSFGCQFGQV